MKNSTEDPLEKSDFAIQHIAGSNLAFADFLIGNPVYGEAPIITETNLSSIEKHEENIEAEPMFVQQSQNSKVKPNAQKRKNEITTILSNIPEKNNNVNKNGTTDIAISASSKLALQKLFKIKRM